MLRTRLDLFASVPKGFTECFPLGLSTTVTGSGLRLAVIHNGRYGEKEIESLADELTRAFSELAI